MSGHGKEGTGSPFDRIVELICIDCGNKTTALCTDLGAGNGKDGPLCRGCYTTRRDKRRIV